MSIAAGHRSLPHTADLLVEAWAPTRAGCLAEAVRALVEACADTGDVPPTRQLAARVDPTDDARQLVERLDEVIYLLDAEGLVPCAVEVGELPDGALLVSFGVVSADAVQAVGAVPKAVSLHELAVEHGTGGWCCRMVIDV